MTAHRRFAALRTAVLAVLLAVATAAPAAAQWNFETLDGNGGENGRTSNVNTIDTAAINWGNQPHVFYRGSGTLRHGWWDGLRWNFETLDGGNGSVGAIGRIAANAGSYVAATVWNNEPHVFHQATVATGPTTTKTVLRHAWWDGRAWYAETLDGDGAGSGRTSNDVGIDISVVVWNNEPHVFHQECRGDANCFDAALRHNWWDGRTWWSERLDGDVSDPATGRTDVAVGSRSSAVNWSNQPHVFYNDRGGQNLRQAWWDGRRWNYTWLDGPRSAGAAPVGAGVNGRTSSSVGQSIAAISWNGQPHVFYRDVDESSLRQAWWNGRQWTFRYLDGARAGGLPGDGRTTNQVGEYVTVVEYRNQPHVFYFNKQGGNPVGSQRHAWWTGAQWFYETLDGVCPPGDPCGARGAVNNQVGEFNSAVVWAGQLHTFYRGQKDPRDDVFFTNVLRHGWYG